MLATPLPARRDHPAIHGLIAATRLMQTVLSSLAFLF